MNSSTKPRPSHQTRTSRTSASLSSATHPLDIPIVHSSPSSPPATPPSRTPTPGARRPSLSSTMHWLSRSPTPSTNTTPYAPAKPPVRISEPKLVRGIDALGHHRTGTLGHGAIVVRTPDEALRDTHVRLSPEAKSNDPSKPSRPKKEKKASISKIIGFVPNAGSFGPPNSPPLPPLPAAESEEELLLSRCLSENESRASSPSKRPNGSTNSPMAPAQPSASMSRSPSFKSSLKIRSSIINEEVIPPLPSAVPAEPCPPFKPILMSPTPLHRVESDSIIVTLETCTATHKTSLETIKSRPSHLSTYLENLVGRYQTLSSVSSVYSSQSDTDELATPHGQIDVPVLSATFSNIHIFLDRPSAPYAHILTHLRSPPAAPEVIPRAILYDPSPPARLERLIELRDEAAFLKLEALYKLCVEEIRKAHRDAAPKMHTRGNSVSCQSIHSVHSMQASFVGHLNPMQTVVERTEGEKALRARASDQSLHVPSYDQGRSKEGAIIRIDNSLSDQSSVPSSRGPPTPPSWEMGPFNNGHMRNKSMPTARSLRSPPAGWI